MKKKISIIALAALLCLWGCAEKYETNTPAVKRDRSGELVTAAQTGEAVTAEETEAETGGEHKVYVSVVNIIINTDEEHNAVQLMGDNCVGVHFRASGGYVSDVAISCPSWSNDIGDITFRIYKWNTDYATTVSAAALAEKTFVDYADNDTLEWYLGDKTELCPEGEYMLWIGGGVDESGSGVGIWASTPNTDESDLIEVFFNGSVTTDAVAPSGSISISALK